MLERFIQGKSIYTIYSLNHFKVLVSPFRDEAILLSKL